MQPIVKIVSELFMMALSILAGPPDAKEFRLDLIQPAGRIETVIVRRAEVGFNLYQNQGDKLLGTMRPVNGKKDAYVLKLGDAPEQTLDFGASLMDYSLERLRNAAQLDLKAKDGVVIHLYRSGDVVYLTPERGRTTYVCH